MNELVYIDAIEATQIIRQYMHKVDCANAPLKHEEGQKRFIEELEPISAPVHPADRPTHYRKTLELLTRYCAVLPLKEVSAEYTPEAYALFMRLNTDEFENKKFLSFSIISILYTGVESKLNIHDSGLILAHNHALVRWLQRSPIKNVEAGLKLFGRAWVTVASHRHPKRKTKARKRSLLLQDESMLLGKYIPNEQKFVVNTYISRSMVKEHNYTNCLNIYAWEDIVRGEYELK